MIEVGAGGGQLVEFARPARRVIAVDYDAAALERLRARLAESGLAEKYEIFQSDFLTLREAGDVVLFEFCLHQMSNPRRALAHAAQLAADVLVLDHAPGSRWSWLAAEDGDVERAWTAVAQRPVRRQTDIDGLQSFGTYADLETRLAAQPPASHDRIATYRGQDAIAIPMPYRLALL